MVEGSAAIHAHAAWHNVCVSSPACSPASDGNTLCNLAESDTAFAWYVEQQKAFSSAHFCLLSEDMLMTVSVIHVSLCAKCLSKLSTCSLLFWNLSQCCRHVVVAAGHGEDPDGVENKQVQPLSGNKSQQELRHDKAKKQNLARRNTFNGRSTPMMDLFEAAPKFPKE